MRKTKFLGENLGWYSFGALIELRLILFARAIRYSGSASLRRLPLLSRSL
jgi:hypothetical protein